MMSVHVLPPLDPDGSVSTAFLVSSGRAAALFAVLAGVGLARATGGERPRSGRALSAVRRGVAARAVVILVVGLGLGALDSGVAVILVNYAVLFVLALPFLGLRAPALAASAVAVTLVAPVLSHLLRPELPLRTFGSPDLTSLGSPLQLGSELLLTGYYPALPWTAYVLAGLSVGRLPLRRAGTALRVMVAGLLLAAAAWLVSGLLLDGLGGRAVLQADSGTAVLLGRDLDLALQTSMYGTTPTTTWWWLAVVAPHSSTPLDLAHTAGVALAVLGACLLVLPRARWWAVPLVAAGSMTLSLYSLHVVLLATLLPRDVPYALGWHVLVALAVATVWRTLVGRGPLEALAARVSAAAAATVRTEAAAALSSPAAAPAAPEARPHDDRSPPPMR